jgi:curli biogenesis system outer membrane secretion channel CsgG
VAKRNCFLLFAFAFFATVGLGAEESPRPAVQPSPTALPKLIGPKKRIAVAKFDAIGSFVAKYGSTDVGGGLSAQLATALADTGRFIVLERDDLSAVLREQEMGLRKVTAGETSAHAGQLAGAQLLIRGAVTEFEQNAGGGGLRIGVGSGLFGGGVGEKKTHGIVGIDLRLIDTTSGQVLLSRKASAKVSTTSVATDASASVLNLKGDSFSSTILGQATRSAIEQAVAIIVAAMDKVPWTGSVVEVGEDDLYVNAGSSAGLQEGDVLRVSVVVREMTDPATGAVLKVFEQPLGDVDVVKVEDSVSLAKMAIPFQTKRGDIVRFVRRGTDAR